MLHHLFFFFFFKENPWCTWITRFPLVVAMTVKKTATHPHTHPPTHPQTHTPHKSSKCIEWNKILKVGNPLQSQSLPAYSQLFFFPLDKMIFSFDGRKFSALAKRKTQTKQNKPKQNKTNITSKQTKQNKTKTKTKQRQKKKRKQAHP